MKENSFQLEKARSRRYPTQTITNTDYADNIALLANTSTQVESLLHSLKQAAVGIGLYVNANKTEYMFVGSIFNSFVCIQLNCFKQYYLIHVI